MAFKTWADGVALPASDLNTYLGKQSVIVCTAGTRPASPIEGMTIYETDTDKLQIYTTATTLWQPPWNMPWGCVSGGYTELLVNGTTTTTTTDIAGLTCTFTAVANRRYKIRAHTQLSSSVAGDYAGVNVADSVGTRLALASTSLPTVSTGVDVTAEVIKTFTAGSTTVKGQVTRVAGTGTITPGAAATAPMFLIVEDIGPSAAPA
jgi:hypothetical protein